MTSAAVFDFVDLDGVAFAAERKKLIAPHKFVANALGPITELDRLATAGLLPRPHHADWLELGNLAPFYQALSSDRQTWVCPNGATMGFMRMQAHAPTEQFEWVAFGLAAQKAAKVAGFLGLVPAQFVAALGEMQSNVYEHSGNSESGLIAFRASYRQFEFMVADSGIGLLQSLRDNPKYVGLQDHGEALHKALTDGISRLNEANRGHGFRPIFVGLANLNATLRFRSGDHALTIDGHPALPTAHIGQKPLMTGFFASVSCCA